MIVSECRQAETRRDYEEKYFRCGVKYSAVTNSNGPRGCANHPRVWIQERDIKWLSPCSGWNMPGVKAVCCQHRGSLIMVRFWWMANAYVISSQVDPRGHWEIKVICKPSGFIVGSMVKWYICTDRWRLRGSEADKDYSKRRIIVKILSILS